MGHFVPTATFFVWLIFFVSKWKAEETGFTPLLAKRDRTVTSDHRGADCGVSDCFSPRVTEPASNRFAMNAVAVFLTNVPARGESIKCRLKLTPPSTCLNKARGLSVVFKVARGFSPTSNTLACILLFAVLCSSRLSMWTILEYFSRRTVWYLLYLFFMCTVHYLVGICSHPLSFASSLIWELKSSKNAGDKSLQSYLRAYLKRQGHSYAFCSVRILHRFPRRLLRKSSN